MASYDALDTLQKFMCVAMTAHTQLTDIRCRISAWPIVGGNASFCLAAGYRLLLLHEAGTPTVRLYGSFCLAAS